MLVKGYCVRIFSKTAFECSHVYKSFKSAKEAIMFPKKGSLERKYGILEAFVYEEYYDIDLNNTKNMDQLDNECMGDVFKLINFHLYDSSFKKVQSNKIMNVQFPTIRDNIGG